MPSDPIGGFIEHWGNDMEDAFRWALDQVRRVSYKPAWRLEMRRDMGGPTLHVEFMTEDSRHPGRPPSYRETTIMADEPFRIERDDLIPVSAAFHVPPRILMDRDHVLFLHWLQGCLEFVEKHEQDEWFRVDGQLVNDPHAPRHALRHAPVGKL